MSLDVEAALRETLSMKPKDFARYFTVDEEGDNIAIRIRKDSRGKFVWLETSTFYGVDKYVRGMEGSYYKQKREWTIPLSKIMQPKKEVRAQPLEKEKPSFPIPLNQTQKPSFSNFDVTSPIIHVAPNQLKAHPKNQEIYEDPDDPFFDESIKKDGILEPIIVNKDYVIISGHRRWRRANRFGLKLVPIQMRIFENDTLAMVELNRYRQKTWAEKLKEVKEIEQVLKPIAEEHQKAGRNLSTNLSKPIDVRKETANAIGVSEGTLTKAKKVYEHKEKYPDIWKQLNKSKISVDKAHNLLERKLEPKSQKTKRFEPKVFTVWNFSKCDERFGVADFPGRVPGQFIQNILFYFTKEADFVVDPMAGSGTTYDVCKLMKRRCLAYDIAPIRPEIKKHDITNGFPSEAKNCDLIFLDPPYFKKLQNKERYNSMKEMSQEQFLSFMLKLAKDCYEALLPKGIVALLISDYIDQENSLLTSEYYNLFKEAGFKPINRIQTPLTTDQYSRHDVDRAKEQKTMLNITRDLYIFRKC